MKCAIFGGTFDPFTKAHEAIVNKILDDKLADRVYIAPTITNWYRDQNDVWLNDEQRLDLCYKASDWIEHKRDERREKTKDYSITGSVNVWYRDITRKISMPEGSIRDITVESWHFIDTLMDFITEYQPVAEDEIYVVIGADQLEFFKKWHRWEDILKLAKLIVVNGRNGKTVESDIPHIDINIDDEFSDVSATKIRKEFRKMNDGFEKYMKMFEDPPIEVLLNHTPIFDLVRKPDPDGKIGFFPVGINSPDWVTVIVEKDGKFLREKQLRYGLMQECEEFVSGMVENNENPIYAAKRELAEETGIQLANGVDDLVYLGKFAANPAFMNNYMHYFYVNLDSTEWIQAAPKLDEHEKIVTYWEDKVATVKDWFNGCTVFAAGALLKMIQKKIVKTDDIKVENSVLSEK